MKNRTIQLGLAALVLAGLAATGLAAGAEITVESFAVPPGSQPGSSGAVASLAYKMRYVRQGRCRRLLLH